MENENEGRSGARAAAAIVIVFIFGVAMYFLFVRDNIGERAMENSGATIAAAWQNLFGSTTYDVNPDNDIIMGDKNGENDENASDTAISALPSSSPDTFFAATTGKTTKKTVAVKKSSMSIASSGSDEEGGDAPVESPIPTPPIQSIATSSPSSSVSSSDAVQIISQPSCAFPSSTSPASSSAASSPLVRKVIVNEIAWMGSLPSGGESATAAANDEWIELKNISSNDIDLAGWSVISESGAIKIIFATGDHVPAGGIMLLARGTGGAVSGRAQKIYSGGLPNAGDELAVLDGQCNVSDFVDASSGWPGGNNTTKQTLERAADHVSWQTSAPAGGTPGAENSAGVSLAQQATSTATTTPASSGGGGVATSGGGGSSGSGGTSSSTSNPSDTGTSSSTATSTDSGNISSTFCPANHIVIAEIQIAGAVAANDFVKLYNPTGDALDVSGWKLRKKSSGGTDASVKVFGKGSSIRPQGYFVWANSSSGFAASINADVSSTETLAADNSVALMNASGTIIDEVAWGTGTSQYVEGNAFPTDPAANQILERNFIDGVPTDSDDNATDFTLH